MIDLNLIKEKAEGFAVAKPFSHCVIDEIFDAKTALRLADEFPDFGDKFWHGYSNALEEKKTCNNWNVFSPIYYDLFTYLTSQSFTDSLSVALFGDQRLYPDAGLNGGGFHIHARGGKLNTHLDYSMHPKLNLQRKLNLIIYLTPNWQEDWGGNLGFWDSQSAERPGKLVKEISPKFNRAVIFDTSQNSWHGLPDEIQCPDDQFRKSIATYYLCESTDNVDTRGKALFAPSRDQEGDQAVLELIKKRASITNAASVYKSGEDQA